MLRAPPPASPYCMAAPTLPPSRKVSTVGVAMRPLKRRFAGHVNYRARAPHRDKPLRFAKRKRAAEGWRPKKTAAGGWRPADHGKGERDDGGKSRWP